MVKVISLSNEAYEKLKALKSGKSFSEVVIELVGNKRRKNIMELFGVWAEDADEWNKIENKIYEDRKKAKLREVQF